MFRTAEIVSAMQAYYRRLGRPLSSGLVSGCAMDGDGVNAPIQLRLLLHGDASVGGAQEVQIDDVTLTAALIMLCRDNRVPLPARAQKSLQRVGEHLCLVATLA